MKGPGHSARLFILINELHPSVRILALLGLAIAVQGMSWLMLLGTALILGVLLLYFRALQFGNILRRTRWLLASLFLIYAFTTPGEYLRGLPFEILPTYEGIASGLQQITRLILMLAGLALLLATTHRESMMAGAYLLLSPLRLVGLAPERFAARLWLTLHYVEQTPLPRRQALRHLLENFHATPKPATGMEKITILLPRLGWRDALVLAVLLGLGVMLR